MWEKEDWWKFKGESDKVLVIDTPPPYPAPQWHVGAAISYTLQDMTARAYRIMGYEVLYPIGMDGNGLPIEFYLEKYEGINMREHDREDFIRLCREELSKWKSSMREVMKRYGLSGDYGENYYETDSEEYRRITQLSFRLLWEKGLIKLDKRPNNWCPKCKTTIADSEVEYQEVEGTLYYIRYPLKDGGYITIATTRPELLFGCKAIIVHPEDERYKHLHGKKAIVPLVGREVEIIPHPSAKPDFGTGAMHICSYGDLEDVRLFRELGLTPENVVDEDGNVVKGPATGPVEEARKKIVELLREEGYLEKEEKIVHSVPLHERCNTPIEIIPMEEYYLDQLSFREEMRKIAQELTFIPERYRQHLLNWIESVNMDWPISRRRYYATEVPVWTCKRCGYRLVKGGEKYWRPWKEDPGERCPSCGANEWEGDGRVLDTWMDSSISVLYITFWGRDEEKHRKLWNAIRLRPQGYDIIRTWLYYTLLRVYQLKGENAFHYVLVNGMGLDKHGRKMSKRLGNVIDPMEFVEEYGADTIRLWFAMESSIGDNYRINPEKVKGMSKFLTKLWNIARFVSMFPENGGEPEHPTDRWILYELSELVKRVKEYYESFDFHRAAQELYSFTWDTFASHYIEMVKKRAFDGDRSAHSTLHLSLRTLLVLWSPIIPFITDAIYRELYGKTVHAERIPDISGEPMPSPVEFNKKVWKMKKERGLKLKDPIEVEIPEELRVYEDDLRSMHNIT